MDELQAIPENNSQAIDILDEMIQQLELKRDYRADNDQYTIDVWQKYLGEARKLIQALWDGWIPVTERLPDEWMSVLMFVEYPDKSDNILFDRFYLAKTVWRNDDKVRVTKWKEVLPPNK